MTGIITEAKIIRLYDNKVFFNRDATKVEATGTANDVIFLTALLTFLFSKERYTSQQRVEIIKIYGRNSPSSRSIIERLVEKFESTGNCP